MNLPTTLRPLPAAGIPRHKIKLPFDPHGFDFEAYVDFDGVLSEAAVEAVLNLSSRISLTCVDGKRVLWEAAVYDDAPENDSAALYTTKPTAHTDAAALEARTWLDAAVAKAMQVITARHGEWLRDDKAERAANRGVL